MPVVIITTADHVAKRDLLIGVADAVAEALSLGDGDVIASLVHASEHAASGGMRLAHGWPVVSIHGSDRGADATEQACLAAEQAVRDWGRRNSIAYEGVWTEWLTPRPPH